MGLESEGGHERHKLTQKKKTFRQRLEERKENKRMGSSHNNQAPSDVFTSQQFFF